MITYKTDYKSILVFSHDDLDGIFSAYAVKHMYDNNLENEQWERNVKVNLCGYSEKYTLSWFKNEVNEFIKETSAKEENPQYEVYMLDYAIQPNEEMIKFKNFLDDLGIEFYWCDHHITAIENLHHYNFKGFQNTRAAGCINTWNFLHSNTENGEISEEPPTAYKMANDFDLWHLESTAFSWEKQILPFSFFIQSLGIDINNNSGNLVKTIKSFIDNPSIIESTVSTIGKSIYNYVMEQCKKNAGNVYESSFNGIPCLVINSLGNNTYEFQNHPKFSEADLLIRWSFDGKRYNYGIYTCKDEIDVGEICTKYFNGGGHRKSGGGNSDKLLV